RRGGVLRDRATHLRRRVVGQEVEHLGPRVFAARQAGAALGLRRLQALPLLLVAQRRVLPISPLAAEKLQHGGSPSAAGASAIRALPSRLAWYMARSAATISSAIPAAKPGGATATPIEAPRGAHGAPERSRRASNETSRNSALASAPRRSVSSSHRANSSPPSLAATSP